MAVREMCLRRRESRFFGAKRTSRSSYVWVSVPLAQMSSFLINPLILRKSPFSNVQGISSRMDTISRKRRSANMARIRSKNTTPELLVRRKAYSLGYRYRLHTARLPGKPDLVFALRKKAVFVHGCFWHQHPKN